MLEYRPINLRKWKIFNLVDDATLNSAELVHVFGCSGESAYLVTAQDVVFAIGENIYGRLGIGYEQSAEKPYRLDSLCGKFVKCFATGSIHTLALTKDGDVYAWGSTMFGQSGNGEECQNFPLKVSFSAGAGKIQQISSADRYCLALTENNELYHWGDILWDSSSRQTTPFPIKLQYDLTIATITCGGFHASAITTCGKLLTWGVNEVGQLGIGDTTIETKPTLVEGQIADQIIVKVACSSVATHALTAEGNLYAWGFNRSSSLFVGSTDKIVKCPQRVIFRNNISDIGCNNLKALICAEVEDLHEVYLWMLDDENKPETLQLTNVNILEAFADQAMPVTCRQSFRAPSIVERSRSPSPKYYPCNKLPRDIEGKLFNIQENSDLTIKLADGEVYVHSLILKTFSDHFRTLLGKNWSSGNAVIDMSQYNPKAYRAFLKYVYCGFVERLEGEEIIALCDIAASYLEIDLKNICTDMFKNCLNAKNVSHLYSLAASSHFEELVTYCVIFSSECLEDVILSKGFETLDPEHCKALVLNATKLKHRI